MSNTGYARDFVAKWPLARRRGNLSSNVSFQQWGEFGSKKTLCGIRLEPGLSRRGGCGREMIAERISVSATAEFEMGRQVCRGCRRAARSGLLRRSKASGCEGRTGYVSARAPEAGRHSRIAGPFRKKCTPYFDINIIITRQSIPYHANL